MKTENYRLIMRKQQPNFLKSFRIFSLRIEEY